MTSRRSKNMELTDWEVDELASRARSLATGGQFKRHRQKQQQSIHTHNKIIAAARQAFTEKKFHFTTIDDIVSLAGVSRATFYGFFKGKEEVLLEIVLAEVTAGEDRFRALISSKKIDQESVRKFITSTTKWFKDKRQWLMSFYIVCDIYEEMPNFISSIRDEYIKTLGERIPAFDLSPDPSGDSEEMKARRCEAHMILYEIEQFALHACFPGWKLNTKVGIDVLTRRFVDFISSVPTDKAEDA